MLVVLNTVRGARETKKFILYKFLYTQCPKVPFTAFGVNERSLDKSREAPENKLNACVPCETRQHVIRLPAAFQHSVNNPRTYVLAGPLRCIMDREGCTKPSFTHVVRSYELNFIQPLKLHYNLHLACPKSFSFSFLGWGGAANTIRPMVPAPEDRRREWSNR
jgi:hypothetical protein